jgi:hypothetical protein
MPATFRVSAAFADGVANVRLWAALAAATLGPMFVAIVLARAAEESLRTLVGPRARPAAFGGFLWLAFLLVGLVLFGKRLRETTHQHALAGVTYAFGALAFAIGLSLVCARLVRVLSGLPAALRGFSFGAFAGLATMSVVWVLTQLARSVQHDPASLAATAVVVDVIAFLAAAVLASRIAEGLRMILALLGPPIVLAVVVLGVATLREPTVCDTIDARAPALGPSAHLVSGR